MTEGWKGSALVIGGKWSNLSRLHVFLSAGVGLATELLSQGAPSWVVMENVSVFLSTEGQRGSVTVALDAKVIHLPTGVYVEGM